MRLGLRNHRTTDPLLDRLGALRKEDDWAGKSVAYARQQLEAVQSEAQT